LPRAAKGACGCGEVLVAEQLLDVPDVGAACEQVGRTFPR
jgi:hypothetical protein